MAARGEPSVRLTSGANTRFAPTKNAFDGSNDHGNLQCPIGADGAPLAAGQGRGQPLSLSGSGGAVDAREVAARYVAALGEGRARVLAGALATFRLTRKVAQNLGAFWSQADSRGWPAALAAWGLRICPERGPRPWPHL